MGQKKMLGPKIIESKKKLGQKNILGQKKMLGPKNIESKKILGLKKNFGLKFFIQYSILTPFTFKLVD